MVLDWISVMSEFLDKLLDNQLFNGIVLVKKGSKTVFCKGFGYANIEAKIPITKDTPFFLGSVSKPITALGILLLVERKKLDLQDQLIQYLPELNYPEITIHHLLTHTSGLQEFYEVVDSPHGLQMIR